MTNHGRIKQKQPKYQHTRPRTHMGHAHQHYNCASERYGSGTYPQPVSSQKTEMSESIKDNTEERGGVGKILLGHLASQATAKRRNVRNGRVQAPNRRYARYVVQIKVVVGGTVRQLRQQKRIENRDAQPN